MYREHELNNGSVVTGSAFKATLARPHGWVKDAPPWSGRPIAQEAKEPGYPSFPYITNHRSMVTSSIYLI